jgi:hypothetical protein
VIAELERWDDAKHIYSWRSLSGLLPGKNFRGTIKVTGKGVGWALTMQASYKSSGIGGRNIEAKGL